MQDHTILNSQILFDHPLARVIVEKLKHRGREQSYFYIQSPVEAGTHLFFAKNLHPSRQNLDPGEELEIVSMTIPEVIDMILEGKMIDGSLQLGILLALQKRVINYSVNSGI